MGNLNNSSNLQLPVPMEVDICDGKIVFLTLKLPLFDTSSISKMLSFRVVGHYRGPNFDKYMHLEMSSFKFENRMRPNTGIQTKNYIENTKTALNCSQFNFCFPSKLRNFRYCIGHIRITG